MSGVDSIGAGSNGVDSIGAGSDQAASPLAPDWLPVPADVNALVEPLWPADAARDDDGALTLGGLPLAALTERFGTPHYVLSEADFRARARAFRNAFRAAFGATGDITGEAAPDGAATVTGADTDTDTDTEGTTVDVYYAGKAFLCTAVARWVLEEGLCLDTASGGEMLVAARAGVPGERMGLHGNNKSDAEIERALDLGVGRIVADSLPEIERIEAVAAARGVRARVMLRLTPGVHAHTHDFIATAHEDQKFGLSLAGEEGTGSPAAAAVDAVLAAAHLDLVGVHCHIGSQIFEPDGFAAAAERLLGFLAEVKQRHGVELPELDLGGGYGIAYVPGDTPRDPADIARATAATVKRTCTDLGLRLPRISIEPGRAIVGPAGVTLYTVGTIKDVRVDVPGTDATAIRRYVSVDGGMSDNARPVLYDADYTAVLASRTSSADPVLCRVVGKHCESGDIVVRDVYLPADLTAGDVLAVPATGAYCWSLSSNYNYLPRPGVTAVADGAARPIVRGETETDLLARDLPGAAEMTGV